MGIQTWVFASNSELSLMPPKEMDFETTKAAITVALFICLIIGADSISGERERLTLEALLLTPTSRTQIILGKFLAALSIWPATMIMTVPYIIVLGQGDEVVGQAIFWGAILGTILAPAFTALSMFVSFWCNSNKTSFFVSLGIYLLFLLPVQLPGHAQAAAAGQFLQWVNPMAAVWNFLEKLLVNNRTFAERWTWLEMPVVFAVITIGLLFLYAASRLRLEGGREKPVRLPKSSVAATAVIVCLMVALNSSTALAQTGTSAATDLPLQIAIDVEYQVVKSGDPIFFNTAVTNNHTEESPPIIVAMNIINLDKEGDVVDPEDWSPQRTQYIDKLAVGESATLAWRVNAILDGDYIIYMVAMPEPGSQDSTSQGVASSGIHLTVTPFHRLNPSGVLPVVFGGPLVVGTGLLLVYRSRRREIDMGEE
jgi:ABC-2 type transport system permease protein